MNREHRVPAGPRRENQSPTRRKENASPTKIGYLRRPTTDAPMLSASSSNNHSLFSFGGRNRASSEVNDTTSTSFDFLPSVSFDDLQSSLETASTDFKLTQFPPPSDQGRGGLAEQGPGKMVERADITSYGGNPQVSVQPPPPTRPTRSGSILRRPSTSSRQPSMSSTASSNSGAPSNAPTAPAAMRPRRQSHYPPVSNSNISNIVKPPRKSAGPGLFDVGDFESRKRRPSVTSERNGVESTRSSIDGGSRPIMGDSMRNLTGSRASKAKSVQPPPRVSQSTLSPPEMGSHTPEHNRSSLAFPRSPRTAVKNGGSAQGSGKRVSVMPGVPHASHATGLGARTISPTDTRRMKRMSMHHTQAPPTLAQMSINPLPLAPDIRATSRSPSMLPRKISTPSSLRTTPDPNRKSYSSGLSINSTNSFNTVRSSTGSIQPRIPQSASSSRLPAPKALNLHPPTTTEGDEDVPPVPAIPKVYESPKNSPAELSFLEKRKSNRAIDASSLHSTSTGSISGTQSNEAPAKVQRRPSNRKTVHTSSKLDLEKKAAAQVKKNLQPLRLPPITLGPLSTPTAAKIAALQEQGFSERNLSPPPTRQMAKTPTTPMTASKTSFFTTGRAEERTTVQHLRSSSSVHRGSRRESPTAVDATSSAESIAALKNGSQRSGMSPFLSSSVPKGGNMESSFLKRSRTGADFTVPPEPAAADPPVQQYKPSGPRAAPKPIATKPPTTKSPGPLSSPEEPPTPSSISSLRRKLSLSWKRSASKGSTSQLQGETSLHSSHSHDSMPPPRIPISATLNNIPTSKPPSPTPSARSSKTGTYLESRRRKSSASSLNAIIAQERKRSDSLTAAAKKESTLDTVVERTTLYNASVVQKILKPKSSTATLRHQDVWTSELDKDDLAAEDEMRKLGSRRKETELAARTLDALRKRATAKERVSPQDAIRIAVLNIYERGEIVDYKDIYFCGTQNAAKVVGDVQSDTPNFGYDDERGDYSIVPGDHLAYRYEIIDILGKGSFGQVVRCIDHKTGGLVAVKIIRNKKRFHQQALVEVNILQKLREWDPKNKHSMVNFTHSFYFRGHLCISTELLDMNLYEFIKSNAFRGFSLKLIRRFTKQLLSSLNLLKQHKVIHCDLKPENILLRHPLHSEIKVIDFGSSCFENEKVYTYIQSRFYRSPEVILGMTYGMPIDMWSLGCILAELFTGVPIFPGENEQEQLACIMEVFGPPEKHLIEKSTRKKLFFDSLGKPRLTVSSKGRRRRPSSKTLGQVLKCDDEAFLDFLGRCMRWDPDRRMKPDEAIRHEFITGVKGGVGVPVRARDVSPSKRGASYGSARPLPEVPSSSNMKGGVRGPGRETGGVGGSPMKIGGSSNSGTRRASGVTGNATAGGGSSTAVGGGGLKRTSTTGHGVGGGSGGGVSTAGVGGSGNTNTNTTGTGTGTGVAGTAGGSSLPRASIRSVSARHYGSSTISSHHHSHQTALVQGQTLGEKDVGGSAAAAALAGANAAMGGGGGMGTLGRR